MIRLKLEIDSAMVVSFLNSGFELVHPLSFVAHMCHGFLKKDWKVCITHVYREANRLADGRDNLAFDLPLGFFCDGFCSNCSSFYC